MKGLRDERGQVMVLTVLCMAVLFGFVAFAVDVGMLLRDKRVMQTAADSGAIAAAAEYNNGYAAFKAAALADAAQNGVTDGVNGTVVVNNGPNYGSYAGIANATNYVEVIVSQPEPTVFMSLFNQNSMIVAARAVATLYPSQNCIYTLNPTPPNSKGIFLSNGGNLTTTCGVLDNAGGSNALDVESAELRANYIGVAGEVFGGPFSVTPITGISTVGDPLNYLTPPTYDPSTCVADPVIGSGQSAGSPSGTTVCYNGLTITAGAAGITLLPGVYIINGSLTISGTGIISGTGVTFYFPPSAGSLSIPGIPNNVALSLTAPTSGPYSGILFYQDPQDSQPMSITPNSSLSFGGIFYLNSAPLSITGSGTGAGSSTFNSSFVVGSLSVSNNSLTLVPYVSPYLTSPLSTPRLVE